MKRNIYMQKTFGKNKTEWLRYKKAGHDDDKMNSSEKAKNKCVKN